MFVRSIFAHATVNAVDGLEEARAMPGVVAVYTAARPRAARTSPQRGPSRSPAAISTGRSSARCSRAIGCATSASRYAVVVAESSAQAQDAAEMIWADAEPLPAVIDVRGRAAADATLLFPEYGHERRARRSSIAWDEDVLAGAEVVVRGRFVNQRLAPVADGDERHRRRARTTTACTVWVSIAGARSTSAATSPRCSDVDRAKIRVIAPDVGGGFGAKIPMYPEYLVVAKAAQLLGRPVRWYESRTSRC